MRQIEAAGVIVMGDKNIVRISLMMTALTVIAIFSGNLNAQVEGGAIVAVDAPAGYRTPAAGGASAGPGAAQGGSGQPATARTGAPTGRRGIASKAISRKPAPARAATVPNSPNWDGSVIGDKYTFLNFEVISAAKPYYTREAKANGAKGLVQVEVLIDTDGKVLTARARTGNSQLHPEAERAALESRFNRPTVNGKPARAIGFLVYRFGPADDD